MKKSSRILIALLALIALTLIYLVVMSTKPDSLDHGVAVINSPIDVRALEGKWEIRWYELNNEQVNRPVQYKLPDSGEASSYWSQFINIKIQPSGLLVSFTDDEDRQQCRMQGSWKDHNIAEFSYHCEDPRNQIGNAIIEAQLRRAYMPDEYTMEGEWRRNADTKLPDGRIELRSMFN